MVLLKNDGILPLKTPSLKIAVVGPLANQTKFLQGNYSGSPSHTVSILEGLKAEFPSAQINFVQGTQFLSKDASPLPPSMLTIDGKPGVRVTYLIADLVTLMGMGGPPPTILTSRIEPGVGAPGLPVPPEVANKQGVLVSSDGTITPQETGDYNLGVGGTYSFFRVSIDGKPILLDYSLTGNGQNVKLARFHFEKGKTYKLNVVFPAPSGSTPPPQLVWAKLDPNPAQEAIAVAKAADVVIAVVGITSELEGEEMPTSEEGFSGGDRTSIDLPHPEESLLESVAGTGKPLIVVLVNGSALSVSWANDHANAILESWYAGEEGGAAVAETISGRNNPGGKLPVTFYKSVSQLPAFDDYSMKGRTYRYFEGSPLYPFGYGLSYSHFTYKGIHVASPSIAAGQPLEAEATVTNAGLVSGDEVVQLYLTFPAISGAPNKALRGFQRVHLEPGESQHVKFSLQPRDLSMVTEAGEPVVPEGEFTVSIGGGQPKTSAPNVIASFHIQGRIVLPE
jgi:beta-glucosidase